MHDGPTLTRGRPSRGLSSLSPSLTMHMHAWVGYPIHARGPSSLSVSQIRHLGLGLRA